MAKLRRPCEDCPWRVDAPREHWAPDHFESIFQNCQDDGDRIMLCHKSAALPAHERKRLICQGWLRVIGTRAIGVRIALIFGDVTEEEMLDKDGPELFQTFEAMLRANKIKLPKRNTFTDQVLERARKKR